MEFKNSNELLVKDVTTKQNDMDSSASENATEDNLQSQDTSEKQIASEMEILKMVNTITEDIEKLRERIEHFSGCSTDDKDYKYLEEMLLCGLVNLDKLETNDNIMLRQARKRAVQYIQKLMKILDARLTENKNFLNTDLESDDEI